MDWQTDKVRKKKFIRFIPLVNITYHWHNTICNFIVKLTVAVVIAIIFFNSLKYIDRNVPSVTLSVIYIYIE
jgi:hypothetical protein